MTKLSVASTERSPIMHGFLAAEATVDAAKVGTELEKI
jgi:hypothetical protein